MIDHTLLKPDAAYDHRISYESFADIRELEVLLKWLKKVPVYSVWLPGKLLWNLQKIEDWN